MRTDNPDELLPAGTSTESTGSGVPGFKRDIVQNAGQAPCTLSSNPNAHLIDTICDEVLPNIVRICMSGKMSAAMDRDHFIRIVEQKIELANKSLKMLPAESQPFYRSKIDRAYAEHIDILHCL